MKGIYRKTWLATGIKKQVVCGLHVPNNLEVIPLSINRDIKKDWFDSDWPAWPVENEDPPTTCHDLDDDADADADPFGPIPDDGDDKIPF